MIVPAKSAAQYRFMKAVESGDIKKKGLSKEEAKHFTQGVKPSTLPEKAKKKP